MLDPVEFGKSMASIVREATAPLLKRIEELEARQLPEPEHVEIDIAAIIRDLICSDDLLSLVELRVKEEFAKIPAPKDGNDVDPESVKALVAEAVSKIRIPKDGEDGDDATDDMVERAVAKYLTANPPAKGADGVGLAGAMIDRAGNLVVTLTNGEVKTLGPVVGKDGDPGADFTEVRFEYDGERTLKVIGKGGEIYYRLPIPIDRGYWRKGQYEKADVTTDGGNAFIALRDTSVKPSIEAKEDWRLLARKGRDGRDGKKPIDHSKPVIVNA